MSFTDIFIRRPVLATVVSLLILLFGLRAFFSLPLRQYPKMENTVIKVATTYAGADATLIQGFITSPLQKAIASADGIDYLVASSQQGSSSIQAYIKLNFDPDKAFTNIMSKVAEVRGELPREAESPVITKSTGQDIALMYISFSSKTMAPQQITDYATRVVQPRLETILGVASANVIGPGTFAMRIWLNPEKMAALGITARDISNKLTEMNVRSAPGKTKGGYVSLDIKASTDLHAAKAFEAMVIKHEGASLVRLRDVARVELGQTTYDHSVVFNGQQAVFIALKQTPEANPLTVIDRVRKAMPEIKQTMPAQLDSQIVYDATKYIRASISEVQSTIAEATLIVVFVIFLFLGSLRSVFIPMLTIPLSLIGVATFMLGMGYSLNLLTLLAMVLAIGLVVDDAIVVVENIHRHIEEGMKPLEAALLGAREIAVPVITMTLTLAAVFTPIALTGGLTGALFREFAFTLAGTVIISGVIALTLSPMLCAKLLRRENQESRLTVAIDKISNRLREAYKRNLTSMLKHYRPLVFLFTAIIAFSIPFLYNNTPSEAAPSEDQSVLFIFGNAPQYANHDYVTRYTKQMHSVFESFKETEDYFIINGMGNVTTVIAGMILKPWDDRDLSQQIIMQMLQKKLNNITGLQLFVFPLPPLPVGGDFSPINFVLTSVDEHNKLYHYAEKLLNKARQSKMFMFIKSDLQYNKPQVVVRIDRNKAAELGVSMQTIGNTLSSAFSGYYVNRFSLRGRSYDVVPQVERRFRYNPQDINNLYVRAESGDMIPLSTLVKIEQATIPNALKQFQQLNAVTISGMMSAGVTLGQALDFLATTAREELPNSVGVNYAGQSRQYIQEGNKMVYTFLFALIVIFLFLAAQFESFRDPLIIMSSIFMSSWGALFIMCAGVATNNIYTQIGLVTLIGLITKHGILMVDFANQLQVENSYTRREAIIEAASIRLRPILMTTAAMVVGVLPLVFASGAGAASRHSIGWVIAAGMSIGTLFTLYIVPAMYTILAKRHADSAKTPSTENL